MSFVPSPSRYHHHHQSHNKSRTGADRLKNGPSKLLLNKCRPLSVNNHLATATTSSGLVRVDERKTAVSPVLYHKQPFRKLVMNRLDHVRQQQVKQLHRPQSTAASTVDANRYSPNKSSGKLLLAKSSSSMDSTRSRPKLGSTITSDNNLTTTDLYYQDRRRKYSSSVEPTLIRSPGGVNDDEGVRFNHQHHHSSQGVEDRQLDSSRITSQTGVKLQRRRPNSTRSGSALLAPSGCPSSNSKTQSNMMRRHNRWLSADRECTSRISDDQSTKVYSQFRNTDISSNSLAAHYLLSPRSNSRRRRLIKTCPDCSTVHLSDSQHCPSCLLQSTATDRPGRRSSTISSSRSFGNGASSQHYRRDSSTSSLLAGAVEGLRALASNSSDDDDRAGGVLQGSYTALSRLTSPSRFEESNRNALSNYSVLGQESFGAINSTPPHSIIENHSKDAFARMNEPYSRPKLPDTLKAVNGLLTQRPLSDNYGKFDRDNKETGIARNGQFNDRTSADSTPTNHTTPSRIGRSERLKTSALSHINEKLKEKEGSVNKERLLSATSIGSSNGSNEANVRCSTNNNGSSAMGYEAVNSSSASSANRSKTRGEGDRGIPIGDSSNEQSDPFIDEQRPALNDEGCTASNDASSGQRGFKCSTSTNSKPTSTTAPIKNQRQRSGARLAIDKTTSSKSRNYDDKKTTTDNNEPMSTGNKFVRRRPSSSSSFNILERTSRTDRDRNGRQTSGDQRNRRVTSTTTKGQCYSARSAGTTNGSKTVNNRTNSAGRRNRIGSMSSKSTSLKPDSVKDGDGKAKLESSSVENIELETIVKKSQGLADFIVGLRKRIAGTCSPGDDLFGDEAIGAIFEGKSSEMNPKVIKILKFLRTMEFNIRDIFNLLYPDEIDVWSHTISLAHE